MAGVVVFNGVGGILSDSIGRRKTILIFSLIHVLFSFLTSISQTYLMFVGVRFFVGGCIHSVWAATFIIAMETVSEPMRTSTGAVFSLGWNVGSLIMTLLAYLLRSWWKLQLAFAFFSLLLSSYYFLVPESPRWLLENGRSSEAKAVLLRIAQVNSTNIDETQFHAHFEELERRILNQTEKSDNENNKKNSKLNEVFGLFSNVLTNKEYLFRLILMIPPWLAVGCSAYGIHFSAKFVNFDIFTVAVIKEAAVFAIILLIVPFFKRGKRVPSVLSIYIVSGSLALIFYFIPSGQVVLQVLVFVLCQGFMVGVFMMIGTYTQDVFSTDIRGTTFNFLDCVSKLGTVFAPFIVDIGGEKDHGLPPAIFGCMMILSSLTLLFTPETKGLPLTQSYKDMKLNSFTKTSILGKLYHKFLKKS
jgi:OCT family organic cation transporter-like MFS transporter 4/5